MIFRTLARTGVRISAVAFGAGPVSGLMTGDNRDLQFKTVKRAIDAGINWFDTAAGYGNGQSEANLGRVLEELGVGEQVHVATKIRVPAGAFGDVEGYVVQSAEQSLRRLNRSRVTLLQLHNGVTRVRGDEPASLAAADVLGGVLAGLRRVRETGLARFVGLTGTGHADVLREVIRSGEFDTLQIPFNLLNPSAGRVGGADGETDSGNVMADCAATGMGVFAIRVFAGGALLDNPPSAHTLTTPYFPLALYERDLDRARKLLGDGPGRAETAVRFALSHPAVSSAIIGFGSPEHVDEVSRIRLDEA